MPFNRHVQIRGARAAIVLLGMALAAGAPGPAGLAGEAAAQNVPSEQTQRYNRAMVQVAKRPRSVDALIEAGEAAAEAGDFDASFKHFVRARKLDEDNARIDLGMARAYLRSGRPVSALPLLAAAEAAGLDAREVLAERALALDMVGDQAGAQEIYQRLLQQSPDDAGLMRALALSHAISGNNAGFEAVLRPLVEKRDFAAFRTRAFGLAIMGEQNRAAAIVDAVMPRDLARRITPYLEYMPRLTPAQQAAAASLGIFPKAENIGRDTPAILAYAKRGALPARSAALAEEPPDARLAPAGEPLGAGSGERKGVRIVEVNQPPASAGVVLGVDAGGGEGIGAGTDSAVGPVLAATTAPGPGFSITRRAPEASAALSPTPPELAPQPAPQPTSQSEPEPVRVADAFADLIAERPSVGAAPSGAVDLSAITIPVERKAAPPAVAVPEPRKPSHPSRVWVQVATGRDLAALGFDWRRIARRSGDLLASLKPHTVPWGEANRLLAGPLKSAGEARDLVNALREKGIDTFAYTSPEGVEIQLLE